MKITAVQTTHTTAQDAQERRAASEIFSLMQLLDSISVLGDMSKSILQGSVESIADARKRNLALGASLKLKPLVMPTNEAEKMKVLNETSSYNQAIMAQQANIQSIDGVLSQAGSIALLSVRGVNNSIQVDVGAETDGLKKLSDRGKDVNNINKPIN